MGKFSKKSQASANINTGSLPDIIFMLLFFFMVTTRMRDTSIMVEQKLPSASQLQEIEQKSLVSYIYVGKPKEPGKFGTEPRVQVNDNFIATNEIPQFVEQEKAKLPEAERDMIWMSLKVDNESKMGVLTDVKFQLREANALKINYSSLRPGVGPKAGL
jgi:biopolymer transport protein ExbD